MAVVVIVDVRIREFSGYPDSPALPLGMWTSTGSALGDGTGGAAVIRFDFNQAGAALDSRYFSLEQISGVSTGVAALAATLSTNNLDHVALLAMPKNWPADFTAGSGSAVATMAAASVEAMRGIQLGRQISIASASGLQFQTSNVDLIVLTVTLGGYFWGVRSLNAPGGPSRPAQGLYRN